mmetsp:Transcript_43005/g.135878  ORF Transcript_43005/g.135878 Transcript_43005/m.135878 type:complete len:86 (+) Transcript_43005:661-918(+)
MNSDGDNDGRYTRMGMVEMKIEMDDDGVCRVRDDVCVSEWSPGWVLTKNNGFPILNDVRHDCLCFFLLSFLLVRRVHDRTVVDLR